jgi:hypothetical protein
MMHGEANPSHRGSSSALVRPSRTLVEVRRVCEYETEDSGMRGPGPVTGGRFFPSHPASIVATRKDWDAVS